jgi:hypothetical protein
MHRSTFIETNGMISNAVQLLMSSKNQNRLCMDRRTLVGRRNQGIKPLNPGMINCKILTVSSSLGTRTWNTWAFYWTVSVLFWTQRSCFRLQGVFILCCPYSILNILFLKPLSFPVRGAANYRERVLEFGRLESPAAIVSFVNCSLPIAGPLTAALFT